MCAMSPRLLRPIAGGIHPEAAAWRSAVIDNGGGTPSATTMRAVSRLCSDIEKAGIRSKFYRFGIFAGPTLNAALVPLYRGPTFGGTTYGNTTDTNNGPFDSNDYVERGATGGLKGNGSSKYLNTGVPANTLAASNTHFGCGYVTAETTAASSFPGWGTWNGVSHTLGFTFRASAASFRCTQFFRYGTATDLAGDDVGSSGTLATGNIVAAYPSFYRNGTASGISATTSSDFPTSAAIFVFAVNSASIGSYMNARLNWYSYGQTMTGPEVVAFTNAISQFNTAMGRA
jgi:hypothetical protein